MEESGSGTYLEDFIMSLDVLPTDFRREVELVKISLQRLLIDADFVL
jgi:hypothetical protein